QIKPHKGLENVIKALELLNREYGYHDLSMTIAGDEKSSPHYVTHLRNLANTLGVRNYVHFNGLTSRDDMTGLYHSHDILVSPSSCEASSNIALLEAMSSGTAVVSTVTGGNRDILEAEINALVFAKENPWSCAEQINRFLKDPKRMNSIRTNARNTVEKNFHIERSAQSIERILEEAFRQGKTAHPSQIFGRRPVSIEIKREKSLTDLVSQTKMWLKFGNVAVFVRNWSRPQVLFHILRRIFEKTTPFLPILFFPIFYEGFFVLTGRRRKISKKDPRQIKKVLVIQLADIGDIILTSPFLRELRRYLPHVWITLIVQPRMFNLLEKCPYTNEVLTFDWRAVKNWNISFNGCIQWWLQSVGVAKRSLWKHHLNMAISTRWNNDPCQAASIILMYMSGASLRIGYKDAPQDQKRYRLKGLNRFLTQGPLRGFPQHEVERQLDILRFLGANPIDSGLEVWTTQEDEFFAQDVLNRFNLADTDLLIAFAPGATWSFRRWPSSRFIELGKWLQENYGASILLIGGKGEQKLSHHIERGMHSGQTVNLVGKTTLREMASVLKHCKLFIGNDSGPLHVATAAGVPVVGLFGPGEYQRFKPWGANHEAICLGLSCSPCSQNCLFNEPRCIKGITVDQVKRVLSKMLESLLPLS
ncbi:MAG: glycosyltransferase, partial [Candidatus Aminicenantes bacterium]|nr:glycosyltransferase [Candidatus Aminicenantes bacterium]